MNFIELPFEYPIWRIVADPSHNLIAFETRNHELRTVKFSAAELTSGKKLWGEVEMEEPWDAGLEDVSHGIVFIHGYLKQGTPEHKGIIALDGKTGKFLWENKEWVLYKKTDQKIICYDAFQESRNYFVAEPGSGLKTSEIRAWETVQSEISVYEQKKNEPFQFPVLINEDIENVDWNRWQNFIVEVTKRKTVGIIEGMKTSKFRIFSFYSTKEGILNNYLLICDLNGKLLLHELMAEKVPGYGMDTFFSISGKICYVREKRFFKVISD
ncbi:MAG: hypothetical protein A3H98_12130 [Bacteroidetes bacterium RIFCSPLOWO2_02_FULL_36_8]|nr:MAG: hypothetical protein A3H98_12130 [Bacteroidetes bacterium RIFCSPLOWO2_02_FULL_36_8]OFY70219.1 MAG: hypothetical protein A3G23_08730 [Bacteroidetes bacterium RIFCSPLOWO2_12_FULL_37_12]